MMSMFWTGDEIEAHRAMFAEASDGLYKSICRFQKVLVQFEKHLGESDAFVIAWLLLDEAERKRHLFKGMKETCLHVSSHYDGRALCREITTAMLKQDGKALTDFARNFVNATKEAGPNNMHLLPSEWWSSTVSMPEPWPEDIKFVFTQLSLQEIWFVRKSIPRTGLTGAWCLIEIDLRRRPGSSQGRCLW
jgi:hypothetical protein